MDEIIEEERIAKRYQKREGGAVAALDGVSFTVARGEVLGLLGPNGAGKTTAVKVLCGLVTPDAGRVRVNGRDVQRERTAALRHISAVLEGNRNLYWRLSARENLEYFAGNRGRSRSDVRGRVRALLDQFRLAEKADEPVSRLSRGMQQKLAVAVAMLADTQVVLLDEPTLGLDVATGYEVRALLRAVAAEGRTLVVSTHDMPVVQDVCARTVIISEGRVVVDGAVEQLLRGVQRAPHVVTLRNDLTAAQRRRLWGRFPRARYTDGARPTIEVALEDGAELYDLMDVLRDGHAPIESIARAPASFERVFLEVLRGQGARPPVAARDARQEAHRALA